MDAAGARPGSRRLTLEQFQRLPDDGYRYDLVDGWLVREPPAGFEHGDLAMELGSRLREFVRERELGRVVAAETGFVLREEPVRVRGPDVAFVAGHRLPPAAERRGFLRLAPDLAVEVVSPSNTWAEVAAKVRDYLEAGTRLVWIVEPKSRSVTVHRPGAAPRVIDGAGTLDGEDVLPGFRVELESLFEQ